jgi:hypothetical protein
VFSLEIRRFFNISRHTSDKSQPNIPIPRCREAFRGCCCGGSLGPCAPVALSRCAQTGGTRGQPGALAISNPYPVVIARNDQGTGRDRRHLSGVPRRRLRRARQHLLLRRSPGVRSLHCREPCTTGQNGRPRRKRGVRGPDDVRADRRHEGLEPREAAPQISSRDASRPRNSGLR